MLICTKNILYRDDGVLVINDQSVMNMEDVDDLSIGQMKWRL